MLKKLPLALRKMTKEQQAVALFSTQSKESQQARSRQLSSRTMVELAEAMLPKSQKTTRSKNNPRLCHRLGQRDLPWHPLEIRSAASKRKRRSNQHLKEVMYLLRTKLHLLTPTPLL